MFICSFCLCLMAFYGFVSVNNSNIMKDREIVKSMKDVIKVVDSSLILTDSSYPNRFQAFYQFNSTNFSILCEVKYFYETLTTKPYVEIYSVKVEQDIEHNPYNIIKPRNKQTNQDIKIKIVKNDSNFAVITHTFCRHRHELCNIYVLSSINFMKVLGKHIMSNQQRFASGKDLIDISTSMSHNLQFFIKSYGFVYDYFIIKQIDT